MQWIMFNHVILGLLSVGSDVFGGGVFPATGSERPAEEAHHWGVKHSDEGSQWLQLHTGKRRAQTGERVSIRCSSHICIAKVGLKNRLKETDITGNEVNTYNWLIQ